MQILRDLALLQIQLRDYEGYKVGELRNKRTDLVCCRSLASNCCKFVHRRESPGSATRSPTTCSGTTRRLSTCSMSSRRTTLRWGEYFLKNQRRFIQIFEIIWEQKQIAVHCLSYSILYSSFKQGLIKTKTQPYLFCNEWTFRRKSLTTSTSLSCFCTRTWFCASGAGPTRHSNISRRTALIFSTNYSTSLFEVRELEKKQTLPKRLLINFIPSRKTTRQSRDQIWL